ncbi:MAG: hypothetical protein R3B13_23755 [Polyangiaceae bacterium]
MRARRLALLALGAASTVALSVACSTEDSSGSASNPAPDAAVDAAVDSGSAPAKRAVLLRNPFGNTAASDNLLVDGDFEWTSGSGQHGWRALANLAETVLPRETGGLCRSGLLCGRLSPGVSFLGYGAGTKEAKLLARVWSKPPTPDCALTKVLMIQCTAATISTVATIPEQSGAPDADGWCRHEAIVPSIKLQPCLFVSSSAPAEGVTLIDDAVMQAVAQSANVVLRKPSIAEKERIERALSVLAPRLGGARVTGNGEDERGGLALSR